MVDHSMTEGGDDSIDGVTNHPLVSEVLDNRDSGAGIRVILKPGATFAGVDVARFATHAAAVEALQGALPADTRGDAAVPASGIYIASKAIHGPRWREWREAGHPIISTWIDEAEKGRTTDWAHLWSRCVAEAARAAVTIVYREDGEELKGARVEVGAALAHGRQVLVVGDIQDSWTRHPKVTRVESIDVATSYAALLIRAAAPTPPAPVGLVDAVRLPAAPSRELLALLRTWARGVGDQPLPDSTLLLFWSQILAHATLSGQQGGAGQVAEKKGVGDIERLIEAYGEKMAQTLWTSASAAKQELLSVIRTTALDVAAISALAKGCSLTCESGGDRLPRVVVAFPSLPEAQQANEALALALRARLAAQPTPAGTGADGVEGLRKAAEAVADRAAKDGAVKHWAAEMVMLRAVLEADHDES